MHHLTRPLLLILVLISSIESNSQLQGDPLIITINNNEEEWSITEEEYLFEEENQVIDDTQVPPPVTNPNVGTGDLACISDNRCIREATYCVSDGCCAVKHCYVNGVCSLTKSTCYQADLPNGEVQVISGGLVAFSVPDQSSADTFNCLIDPFCPQPTSYCLPDGCCVSKVCDGSIFCSLKFPDCVVSLVSPEARSSLFTFQDVLTPEQTCMINPTCKQNVSYCLYEGCCSNKNCPDGVNCVVTVPIC